MSEPQTVAVFGGTSEIGLETARRLVTPSLRRIVLACRDVDAGRAAAETLGTDVDVDVVHFDAARPETHEAVVNEIVTAVGDLDVAVLAFGILGEQAIFDADPTAAADAINVNYVGAVTTSLALASVFRRQGHGRLVVLSSVAGERTRKANYVYGSSKAGLDGFAQGLGDSLAGSGASVLVVRPGFVHTRMTAGLAPAPLSTTPAAVADAIVAGLRRGRRTIWVPAPLRLVMMVLRHLPGPVYRRLPIN